jgi:hypothetical protein
VKGEKLKAGSKKLIGRTYYKAWLENLKEERKNRGPI